MNNEITKHLSTTEKVQQELLSQSDLDIDLLVNSAGELTKHSDCGDIFLQSGAVESWMLETGKIRSGSYSAMQGMSVRSISGTRSFFAYADAIDAKSLKKITSVVSSCPNSNGSHKLSLPTANRDLVTRYPAANPIASEDQAKITILQQINESVRKQEPRVVDVQAALSMSHSSVLIVRSDGEVFTDIRPLLKLSLQVVLADNNKTETGVVGMGGRATLDMFDRKAIEKLSSEAIRQADIKLGAIASPAGNMPVVLGNGWAGILLHEAVGHGLEGDFNRKEQSAFSGRVGQQVAHPAVTVCDDGTLDGLRGSLTCDDEGTPSRCNVLIEKGVLKGYMQDTVNASLMKTQPTGNGRRESYAHLPMPRMTNTYMCNGNYEPEEIIASVDKGIYCKSFDGGQVNITNGNFVFASSEAYLIVDGKLGPAVKGATITGNGPDAMCKLSMVASDLELDPGVGTCGKNGQWVPVGVGQPTCKVDELVVGGTDIN